MRKIVFVCTGNSCRSVMAEGLFRKMTEKYPGKYSVMSAGISAMDGYPASEETIQLLEERGIDMSGHASQRLRAEMVKAADKVLVMERMHRDWILRLVPEAEHKVYLMSQFSEPDEYAGADIPDPIRMSENFYRNVFALIERCVEGLVRHLERD